MFGAQTSLSLNVFDTAEKAAEAGNVYHGEKWTPVHIDRVVVVKNGTESGNSTVDFVMTDPARKQYVVMLTGALLKSIPTDFR